MLLPSDWLVESATRKEHTVYYYCTTGIIRKLLVVFEMYTQPNRTTRSSDDISHTRSKIESGRGVRLPDVANDRSHVYWIARQSLTVHRRAFYHQGENANDTHYSCTINGSDLRGSTHIAQCKCATTRSDVGLKKNSITPCRDLYRSKLMAIKTPVLELLFFAQTPSTNAVPRHPPNTP